MTAVLEDDRIQASEMAAALEAQGSEVVGPFLSREDGLVALDKDDVQAAILDIRLADAKV